ncbi:MAG: hypothetical protein OEZ36_10035 [Spirochaetota bacterium]|nr:hypothetical protein [Spirochaetota bacterium]
MKKLILTAIMTMFLGVTAYSITEEGNFDKEDETLKSDLYLSEEDFMLKYVKMMQGADSAYLYKIYSNTDVPETKIAILIMAAEKGFNDPYVLKMYSEGLRESFFNYSQYKQPLAASDNWRVRAAAAYQIFKKPTGIEPANKRKLILALMFNMRNDPQDRVQGISALALAKLFEGETDDPGKPVDRTDVLTKGAVIEMVNEQLVRVTTTQQFYCWALVKATGILKSNKSFFVLLETRKRGFNQKVKLEISRSLTNISGGGVSGGPSK